MVALNRKGNHLKDRRNELFNYIILFECVDRKYLGFGKGDVIEPDIINSAFEVTTPVNIVRARIIR